MSTSHQLHNTVYARLDAIASAEKITRKELGALSREALTYVMESHDIELVNRLIGVLTPVNRKAAILYFTHFLPWVVEQADEKFSRFGKMNNKPKVVARMSKAIDEWLAVETNNLWVWADQNIEIEQKKFDTAGALSKALVAAINGVDTDKSIAAPMSKHDVMAVIMKEINVDEIMEALGTIETELAAAEPEPVQQAA